GRRRRPFAARHRYRVAAHRGHPGSAAAGGVLMDGDRGMSLLVDIDQWLRCAHQNTALLDGGGVTLTWSEPTGQRECQSSATDPDCAQADRAGGLAFDRWCRAYVSRPQRGRVDVTTWPDGQSA